LNRAPTEQELLKSLDPFLVPVLGQIVVGYLARDFEGDIQQLIDRVRSIDLHGESIRIYDQFETALGTWKRHPADGSLAVLAIHYATLFTSQEGVRDAVFDHFAEHGSVEWIPQISSADTLAGIVRRKPEWLRGATTQQLSALVGTLTYDRRDCGLLAAILADYPLRSDASENLVRKAAEKLHRLLDMEPRNFAIAEMTEVILATGHGRELAVEYGFAVGLHLEFNHFDGPTFERFCATVANSLQLDEPTKRQVLDLKRLMGEQWSLAAALNILRGLRGILPAAVALDPQRHGEACRLANGFLGSKASLPGILFELRKHVDALTLDQLTIIVDTITRAKAAGLRGANDAVAERFWLRALEKAKAPPATESGCCVVS
jgi:hypothetical protein